MRASGVALLGMVFALLVAPSSSAACSIKNSWDIYFEHKATDFPEHAEASSQLAQIVAFSVTKDRVYPISVVGHTDTFSSTEVEVEESKQRAYSVAAELVRHGLPEETISVSWRGSAELRLPTPDGRREPLNRRVVMYSARPIDPNSVCPGPLLPPGMPNE